MALKMDVAELEHFMATDFAQTRGMFKIDRLAEMELDLRLLVNDDHLRPGGTVSGPSMFTLADCAVYLATLAMIGPKALAVTTNCSIDFMRKPAANTDIIGKTRLLKLGKVLSVGDVMMFSEGSDKPVARATLTYSIPPTA